MENTIELPAETNPLNQQTLLEVLNSATSGKSQQVQSSTKQLQEWETKSGFYSLLQVYARKVIIWFRFMY